MNGQMLEEVNQFKYLGFTQNKDGASIKEVKIRLEQAHSAMTRLAILWKTKSSIFPQRLYSIGHLSSLDVRAGCKCPIWKGESRPLK